MREFDLTVVPEHVFVIAQKLRAAGFRSWIVGGCVRDSILGKKVADWDLATDALPQDLIKAFPRAIPTGLQHGTVTVVLGGQHYEVTTLRGETTYSDGRRPDAVSFVSDISADLARRDFTVNAIAVATDSGALVDPYEGRKDIDRKTIKAVGKAMERFSEDGLRVLRAARFCATLDFELDPDTFAAIGPTLDTFKKVSAERVRDEWVKTMKARKPSRAFDVMRDAGIMAITCPEMMEGVGVEQNRWHTFDVWRHSMACMDACAGDPILRIAALLHDVGKPRTRAFSDKTQDYTFYDHDKVGAEIADPICERLRFSNDERTRIVHLVRHHLFHYDGWSDAAVRRWIRRVGKDRLADLVTLSEADLRGKATEIDPIILEPLHQLKAHVERILAAGAALSTSDLAIDGNVLIKELGIKPGRIIGEILAHLLEEVIADPSQNTREALLAKTRVFLAARQASS